MKLLLSACLSALLAAAIAPAQDPAKPAAAAAPLVGTVDLLRVFEQNPKWSKAKAELEKMQDAFKAQIKKQSDRVAEIRALIDASDENSDQWRNARFELELTMKQREFMSSQASERLELENNRAMLEVYQDIEVAVAQVAKARGVGLVHRLQPIGAAPGEIGKLQAKDVSPRLVAFERKQVWYAAPELDLTDDLIKALMAPIGGDGKPAGGKPEEASAKPAPAKQPAGAAPKAGG
jgi:Skp family chaperone for outer membrane proteins